jgi:hypothetical protein
VPNYQVYFHDTHTREYIEAYPRAAFIAPSGLLRKRPELTLSSFVPGIRFPLAQFLAGACYVREEHLFSADAIIAPTVKQVNPSHTRLSWLQADPTY